MEAQPEFRGKKEERTLAERVFHLMLQQGAMYALDTPIRQSLHNLADYFVEHKLMRKDRDEVARLIDAALGKNDHIFVREEREGEVIYATTRRGQPVNQEVAPALPPRYLHAPPQGATQKPRRRAVRRPPMSPFWVRAAIRQMQPPRPTPALPTTPLAIPTVEEVAIGAAVRKAAPVTRLVLADGAEIDFRDEPAVILARSGEAIGRVLKEALDRDFRLVSFGDAWYHEDLLEHFSKGRLNEIRRYILEEETPLSDEIILGDLLFKTPRDPDYEQWAFSLNARLLREKKDFEYVGVAGANLWAVKGLPAIGSRFLKATEIGQDYGFLLEEQEPVEPPSQIEHFLTFYEYHHGVLPYDARFQAFFPPAFLEGQRSAYLRFEIPQHYEAYAVELRYPSGNRGGWLWGLEEFFINSLVPGAMIIIARTEEPNVFVLQYIATDAQERRLLTFDERKNRYTFEETTFYCETEESLLLSEEHFPSLRNTNPLPPSTRKRPADVVANAFTKVNKKKAKRYHASQEDLFAVVNIERPFSLAFLQRVLAETEVFAPADEEGVYIYTPGEEGI
jgi:hypothetical protein